MRAPDTGTEECVYWGMDIQRLCGTGGVERALFRGEGRWSISDTRNWAMSLCRHCEAMVLAVFVYFMNVHRTKAFCYEKQAEITWRLFEEVWV